MTVETVIDGDLIAFKAAAAGEKRTVDVYDSSGKYIGEYKNRTEFKATIPKEQHNEYEFKDIQRPEPIENVLHTVKKMINGIAEKCEADEYFTALSGKNNFRDEIPLPTKYKSNRKGTVRPLLLGDVREYIVNHHDCVVTDGYEADDYLSMRAFEGWKYNKKIIQTTLDKDSMQCKGWVFNWDKHEKPIYIDAGIGSLSWNVKDGVKGQGHIWLLAQSVLGDATDDYKPSELAGVRWGDKGCYTLLKDCKTFKAAYKAVYNQYKQWYPEPVTYTAWDGKEYTKDAVEIWQMYFDCARMLQYTGEYISVKEVLDKLNIGGNNEQI